MSTLQRLSGLIRRWRVDRRLPPSVTALVATSTRLRRDDAARRLVARLRRVLGASESGEETLVRRGTRRLVVAGPLPRPLDEIGTDTATAVVAALRSADIEPFLTTRRRDGLECGILLEQRRRAAEVLRDRLAGAWYVIYLDGRTEGVTTLVDLPKDRRAMRSREWNVVEGFAWGDRLIGESAGCRVTFWTPGSSSHLEKVGTRGQARFLAESPRTTEVVRGLEYPGVTAFPVGANLEYFDEPIDLVYTWVDGADPEWHEEFLRWRERDGRPSDHAAFDPARYTSRDELRYSLRSVWAYCGWVRRIHVVTCGQVPPWLVEDDRLRVVRHGEILPDSALPTFNSHAIEAALHRIGGLAEHFVYVNDDVCIARPVRPELFFTSNGLAKMFLSDALVPGAEDESTIAVDTGALRGRELLRERFGRVAGRKPLHAPLPLRRSVMELIESDFPEVVEQTMHSRFRSASDLSIAASFAQNYGLALGLGVIGELASEYASVESGRLSVALDRVGLAEDLDAFCLNETVHLGGDHAEREAKIAAFFESMFPVPSPWERAPGEPS